MPIELNKVINNRYFILRHLASGGMADIYEAKDLITCKEVTLKFLKDKSLNNESDLEQFKSEARFLGMFNHQNIMKIYNIGEFEEIPFMSLELLKGKTLKDVLDNRGKLSLDECIDYMLQILNATNHIHERGVLHNDLKLDNIFVQNDGYLKIIDFGISTHNNSKEKKNLLGSLNYLAPEVMISKKYSVQSDIYSLGIIFYELLTGNLPFKGADLESIYRSKTNDEVASVSRYVSTPNYQDIDYIIANAIDKSLLNRYKSDKEFIADLTKLKRREPLKESSFWKKIFK